MRIWSISPRYLDSKGLVALWRESLLAKKVLEGKTKGYTNHPQLNRFKNSAKPVDSINQYLSDVYNESLKRGYKFDKTKINYNYTSSFINVTSGQIKYEVMLLKSKLLERDPDRIPTLTNESETESHPFFRVVEGKIEDWEKIRSNI